ncbi:Squamosa promoter-binding-like protein 1 [Acorus calamus]|uniref:Squamosa promoter-binding-like protein 1 n=1 Tax=Acorus calamus TaxID=4465 RepID=A0AAV9EX14_ACOCL|nr:Squamosa promoter-binding-like protein 1 [Acorus calamus]
MEAGVGSEPFHPFYGLDLGRGMKKSVDWDVNDWAWDGERFLASRVNPAPSECRSHPFFPVGTDLPDEGYGGLGQGRVETEKRRRFDVVEEEEGGGQGALPLTLRLGDHVNASAEAELADWEGKNGKKSKTQTANPNRSICQVEGCNANLKDAKDYHRRHKVCEAHAKASKALVGNVMQRFCQQCSRFHHLQEFDEGKRSCRRRLAGHNRRRRKTHPDAVAGGNPLIDIGSILNVLLKLLSNSHSDNSAQAKDQELVSHLLKNLATLVGQQNQSGLLQGSQDTQNKVGTSAGPSSEALPALTWHGVACPPVQESSKHLKENFAQNPLLRSLNESSSVTVAAVEMPQKRFTTEAALGDSRQGLPSQNPTSLLPVHDGLPAKSNSPHLAPPPASTTRKPKNDFDLNDTYDASQDCIEVYEGSSPGDLETGTFNCASWMLQDSHQASPPRTSGNSDSGSAQSTSSSNGESRTDRIVFKLFGKDPGAFPLLLRTQILDWLSHSPTDIEGYIRPGCIILTIYLRLTESAWEKLCHDLSSSLCRLLNVTNDNFWKTGWVYVRVQHRVAFIYNGRVLLDVPLLQTSHSYCKITSITPIAVPVSGRVDFSIKGYNFSRSTTRLLCAFEGKYLVQENAHVRAEDSDVSRINGALQSLSFSCSLPDATGRGFVELEDHGFSSAFFPFIVAEEDLCSEIRTLERAIEEDCSDDSSPEQTKETKIRSQALDFLHEMGWLLRRSQLRSMSPTPQPEFFHLSRFKSLMDFSMDRNWCAVVKKLLDILFDGIIDTGCESSPEPAVLEMGLLHRAVGRNCRPMVELLLRYAHPKYNTEIQKNQHGEGFLFKPNMCGPAGITPLHIAASTTGALDVLDALTNDPGQLGIQSWKTIRDATGYTPEDYARSKGHNSYIDLLQKKTDTGKPEPDQEPRHVVLDIPTIIAMGVPKEADAGKQLAFQMEKPVLSCKLCINQQQQRMAYRDMGRRSLFYRPMMLSMVGIAAVCVCVGILLKGPPEVWCAYPPFRWEMIGFGTM